MLVARNRERKLLASALKADESQFIAMYCIHYALPLQVPE